MKPPASVVPVLLALVLDPPALVTQAAVRAGSEFQINTYTTSSFVGSEFRVSSDTNRNESMPAVAANATGAFVLVWQSDASSGEDDHS